LRNQHRHFDRPEQSEGSGEICFCYAPTAHPIALCAMPTADLSTLVEDGHHWVERQNQENAHHPLENNP